MAEPIPFTQQNGNLKAPSGSPDVLELPIHRADGMILSKWRLTKPEIEDVLRTGIVWLWVLGDRMPPAFQASLPISRRGLALREDPSSLRSPFH